MVSVLALSLASLLVGAHSDARYLECGTDTSSRLRVGQNIMQRNVERAPSDSPVTVEVHGSTVTVSSQHGVQFVAKAFGEGATLSAVDASGLQLTKDCSNQMYTVNGQSSSYTFSHNKAESIVVGYYKPGGLIPFAPGKVHLVEVKIVEMDKQNEPVQASATGTFPWPDYRCTKLDNQTLCEGDLLCQWCGGAKTKCMPSRMKCDYSYCQDLSPCSGSATCQWVPGFGTAGKCVCTACLWGRSCPVSGQAIVNV